MRVLITGGAGFIGSHTAERLLERGYEVRILDGLLPPVHTEPVAPGYVPAGAEFIHGDVRQRGVWEEALKDVAVVFHLAAYQDYLMDFATFFHTNTVGTALLYEVAVERRLGLRKIIVASSQAVYGEGRYQCLNCPPLSDRTPAVRYPPIRDNDQLLQGRWEVCCPVCGVAMVPAPTDETTANPYNQYAVSKYTQEMVALSLGRRYELPTVCLRYSIVQGPRQSFRNAYSGVLRIFTQRILHDKRPVCYEDGEQLRDYVSVEDVVAANLCVLEDDRANFQVFNVGGDRTVSVRDYARLIARRAGVALEPEIPGIYRYGDTRHIFSDVTKLKSLGWQPAVPLETIVDGYLAWARSQPEFDDYSSAAQRRMEAAGVLRRTLARADGQRGL